MFLPIDGARDVGDERRVLYEMETAPSAVYVIGLLELVIVAIVLRRRALAAICKEEDTGLMHIEPLILSVVAGHAEQERLGATQEVKRAHSGMSHFPWPCAIDLRKIQKTAYQHVIYLDDKMKSLIVEQQFCVSR